METNFPQDLYYSEGHTWVKIENKVVRVGITKHAADTLKDILILQVEPVGSRVRRMEPLGVVESIKAISEIMSPVSGIIKAVNEKVIAQPWLINYDPYGEGWIALIEPSNPKELELLMKAEEYLKIIQKERS